MTKNYDVCLSNILHVPKRCNSCQHGIYRVKLVGDFATYYAFNLELLIEGKHTTKLYGHALILPDLSYWSDCSEWPDWLNWIIIIICGCHLQSWSDKNEVHWQLLPWSSQIRSQIRFWISWRFSESRRPIPVSEVFLMRVSDSLMRASDSSITRFLNSLFLILPTTSYTWQNFWGLGLCVESRGILALDNLDGKC